MTQQYFVRLGVFGQIGRFRAVEPRRYPRQTQVVCRTARGLEVGEVTAAIDDGAVDSDGSLLRALTVEDRLLLTRIDSRKDAAFAACTRLLDERGLPAVLVDVEHLFDGQSLYFYFLGDSSAELDALTAELADAYEAKVQFRQFTETLTAGCGPDCGTEKAGGGGCGSGGCSTCAVASACSSRAN